MVFHHNNRTEAFGVLRVPCLNEQNAQAGRMVDHLNIMFIDHHGRSSNALSNLLLYLLAQKVIHKKKIVVAVVIFFFR